MEIKLTKEESEKYFLNALCNGLGELSGYSIELEYTDEVYKSAKANITETNPSYEDVLMQILKDGNGLELIDMEGGEDTVTITIEDVYNKMPLVPFKHLSAMILENDDAETADVILQTIIYGNVIFA
jgi:hypothetical protein